MSSGSGSASDTHLIKFRLSGKENVTHKPAIEYEHLKQLKARGICLLPCLLSLLRNVWFRFVLSFC